MAETQALRDVQEAAGAEWVAFGDAGDAGAAPVQMVQTFGEYEAEYAAIRKGVGILHEPQRAVIRLAGEERRDFLHRFVTNDTNGLAPGQTRRAFMLNNKGRIEADMLLVEDDDHTLVHLDRHRAAPLSETLEQFLFTEDVQITNEADVWQTVTLHGPAGGALLEKVSDTLFSDLANHHARTATIAGTSVVVYRRDETGAPGLHMLIPASNVAAVYEALLEPVGGLTPEVEGGVRRAVTGRGIGWLAYNTARIEAGTGLYCIDFGPDSLPAETGPLAMNEAVSFTKGCYLGQEIVARMHSRGRPKRILVGLRFNDDKLPIAGSQVFATAEEEAAGEGDSAGSGDGERAPTAARTSGDVIGGISSSTVSPMLGNVAIALAVVKWGHHKAGTRLLVPAEGQLVPAVVEETPRFIP